MRNHGKKCTDWDKKWIFGKKWSKKNLHQTDTGFTCFGALTWTRTRDLLINSQPL